MSLFIPPPLSCPIAIYSVLRSKTEYKNVVQLSGKSRNSFKPRNKHVCLCVYGGGICPLNDLSPIGVLPLHPSLVGQLAQVSLFSIPIPDLMNKNNTDNDTNVTENIIIIVIIL